MDFVRFVAEFESLSVGDRVLAAAECLAHLDFASFDAQEVIAAAELMTELAADVAARDKFIAQLQAHRTASKAAAALAALATSEEPPEDVRRVVALSYLAVIDVATLAKLSDASALLTAVCKSRHAAVAGALAEIITPAFARQRKPRALASLVSPDSWLALLKAHPSIAEDALSSLAFQALAWAVALGQLQQDQPWSAREPHAAALARLAEHVAKHAGTSYSFLAAGRVAINCLSRPDSQVAMSVKPRLTSIIGVLRRIGATVIPEDATPVARDEAASYAQLWLAALRQTVEGALTAAALPEDKRVPVAAERSAAALMALSEPETENDALAALVAVVERFSASVAVTNEAAQLWDLIAQIRSNRPTVGDVRFLSADLASRLAPHLIRHFLTAHQAVVDIRSERKEDGSAVNGTRARCIHLANALEALLAFLRALRLRDAEYESSVAAVCDDSVLDALVSLLTTGTEVVEVEAEVDPETGLPKKQQPERVVEVDAQGNAVTKDAPRVDWRSGAAHSIRALLILAVPRPDLCLTPVDRRLIANGGLKAVASVLSGAAGLCPPPAAHGASAIVGVLVSHAQQSDEAAQALVRKALLDAEVVRALIRQAQLLVQRKTCPWTPIWSLLGALLNSVIAVKGETGPGVTAEAAAMLQRVLDRGSMVLCPPGQQLSKHVSPKMRPVVDTVTVAAELAQFFLFTSGGSFGPAFVTVHGELSLVSTFVAAQRVPQPAAQPLLQACVRSLGEVLRHEGAEASLRKNGADQLVDHIVEATRKPVQ
jgi:hypothetical protein